MQAGAATQPPDQHVVGVPQVPGPRGAGGRTSATEHEVGAVAQGLEHPVQLVRVEAAVGVHERDDVGGGGEQARMARRTEAPAVLRDDQRAQPAGDVRAAVGGPVVDDHRAHPGRHPRAAARTARRPRRGTAAPGPPSAPCQSPVHARTPGPGSPEDTDDRWMTDRAWSGHEVASGSAVRGARASVTSCRRCWWWTTRSSWRAASPRTSRRTGSGPAWRATRARASGSGGRRGPTPWCSTCGSRVRRASTCCARCGSTPTGRRWSCCPASTPSTTASSASSSAPTTT